MICLPIVLLALLEVGLRWADVGHDYPFVIRDGDQLQLNIRYPHKYFSRQDIMKPEFIEQSFPVDKDPETVRIVCLGGSTTAGFPYEVNINFPYFVQAACGEHFPEQPLEMINLGVSAINSHAVVEMLPHILELQPDAVMIYMGHNEFYGALGVASTEFFGANRAIIQFILKLRSLRIYQLLERLLIGGVDSDRSNSETREPSETLMRQMIRQQLIPAESDAFTKTVDNYRANLKQIITTFENKQIPVLVSDVVSNQRDMTPLDEISLPDDAQKLAQQAAQLAANSLWTEAAVVYEDVLKQHPEHATTHFRYAHCLLQIGRKTTAAHHFQLACDYDQMRFRAPSAINDVIQEICAETNALQVSTAAAFAQIAPDHVPGRTLFLEHLHPNERGYLLLADTFVAALPSVMPRFQPWPDDDRDLDVRLAQADFTELDVLIGEIIVSKLMDDFPLEGKVDFSPRSVDFRPIYDIASAHVDRDILWDEAHYNLGAAYEKADRLTDAAREYEAVRKVAPQNFTPYYKLGDVYLQQDQLPRAIDFYQAAVQRAPYQAFLQAKLGKAYIVDDQDAAGVQALQAALDLNQRQNRLGRASLMEIYYLLGLGHARQNEFESAVAMLNKSLGINRTYQPALELMGQIQAVLKQ